MGLPAGGRVEHLPEDTEMLKMHAVTTFRMETGHFLTSVTSTSIFGLGKIVNSYLT